MGLMRSRATLSAFVPASAGTGWLPGDSGNLGRATAPVKVLAGGTAAWRAAGLPVETGQTLMWETSDDVYYKPYDGKTQVEQAMRDYLDWEVALVEKIARDSDVRFVDFPA